MSPISDFAEVVFVNAEVKENLDEERAFYGVYFPSMEADMKHMIELVGNIRKAYVEEEGRDPVEHVKARIKTAQSMKEKLVRRQLPVNAGTAVRELTDAVGIRIVCTFVSDVYKLAEKLESAEESEVWQVKDYIKDPKPNGYRSYHLILQMKESGNYVEIQIRTIAMDCWASLEHQLKYKKDISHQELLVKELKRCADEIASTDLSLETIRDMISREE